MDVHISKLPAPSSTRPSFALPKDFLASSPYCSILSRVHLLDKGAARSTSLLFRSTRLLDLAGAYIVRHEAYLEVVYCNATCHDALLSHAVGSPVYILRSSPKSGMFAFFFRFSYTVSVLIGC